MSDNVQVKQPSPHRHDLGVILCKSCGEVVGTLPTDGYKKFYVLCDTLACMNKNKEENK